MSNGTGLSPEAESIWFAIYPYIGEDNIAYGEEEMEKLCEDVLPKIWDMVLEMNAERRELLYGNPPQ